jgi:hypothetical protein
VTDRPDGLFPEWQPKITRGLPDRIYNMHRFYGHGPEGRRCKQCKSFARYSMGSTWFKCHKSRVSRSIATDWRANWPACGAFEEEQ